MIPGLESSTGEGIGYPLQYSWASLMAQVVKNSPEMWETWVQSLAWEDPLKKEMENPLQYSMDRGAWWATAWGGKELDTNEQLTLSLHFHFTKI